MTPSAVLRHRLRAAVTRLRADGHGLAVIAATVGYSSDTALCNAFARRGWPMPRRPRGRRG